MVNQVAPELQRVQVIVSEGSQWIRPIRAMDRAAQQVQEIVSEGAQLGVRRVQEIGSKGVFFDGA